MPRSLSPERQRELDELRRLLLVFAEFKSTFMSADMVQLMIHGIETAYRARSFTGLRTARNDMVEMAQACTPDQLRQLDRLLREHASTSINELFEKRNARVRAIRERGRLSTDEQYYLVREYFEFIWDDPDRAEEAAELQRLMSAYEEGKVRAAERKKRSPRM